MEKLIETWVAPFYMNVLHGNYTTKLADPEFAAEARKAIQNISPEIVVALFEDVNWRCQITAAWFAGMKQWKQFEPTIGSNLLASRVCYAGQGYCFALARFADAQSSDYLVDYLKKYLPQIDKYYDQTWAMPALIWIDRERGTHFADQFLDQNGLWDKYIADKRSSHGALTLIRYQEYFEKVMEHSLKLLDSRPSDSW